MADVVFDGTVTAVEDDQVTFDVNQDFKGAGDSITLRDWYCETDISRLILRG